MSLYLVCILIVFVAAVASHSRKQGVVFPNEGPSTCKTKNGRSGACIEIKDCPSVLKTISTESPHICSFAGSQLIVCCESITSATKNGSTPLTAFSGNQAQPLTQLSSADCGKRPIQIRRVPGGKAISRRSANIEVVGGEISVPYSWPWMVVITKMTPSGKPRFLCGGTLINQRFVLTAAHCLEENLPSSQYHVLVGVHVKTEGASYDVERVIVNEQYSDKTGYNDIALLKLSKPVQMSNQVRDVCLPQSTDEDLTGRKATVTGWGDTSFGGRSSNVLQEVEVPIVSNKECNNSYYRPNAIRFKDGILESQLCAGFTNGGKDACQGDSGGPLVMDTGINKWSIVGIVSFGKGCADAGYPGVYTRVSNLLTWIRKNAG